MIGLAFTGFTLGVLIGVLVLEVIALVVMAWVMHRKFKTLEETVKQLKGSDNERRH